MSQAEIESTIIGILSKYSISQVGIFGSYARHENQPQSDIDILVSFVDSPSLLQLVKIEQEISTAIGIKVDLVTENSVKNPKMISYIRKDLKVIYHA